MTVVTQATIQASLSWKQTDTPNASYDTSTIADAGAVTFSKTLTSGTGNSAIDNVWWNTMGFLASGAQQIYNFSSISREIFGTTLESNFSNIKAIIIENLCTGDNTIYVTATGNGFTYPFNGNQSGLVIPPLSPGLFINYVSGWVVDAAHNVLQLNNLGRSGLNYRIGVVGVGD